MRTRRDVNRNPRITQNGWIDPFTKNLRERLDLFGVPSSSIYYPFEYRSISRSLPVYKNGTAVKRNGNGKFFLTHTVLHFKDKKYAE